MTTQEFYGILRDFLNGETIQFRLLQDPHDKWSDITVPSPLWNLCEYEYRVKRVEVYINIYKNNVFGAVHLSPEEARKACGCDKDYARIGKFVEVPL